MTPKQKAWLKLIALVISTGIAAMSVSYTGGCKLWLSIVVGIGTGMSNVYTSLKDSPNDAQ